MRLDKPYKALLWEEFLVSGTITFVVMCVTLQRSKTKFTNLSPHPSSYF